jgi:phage tail-like protein
MATKRDNPYGGFNFLVDIGGGTEGPDAGFQEVGGLSNEVTVAEYRPGNARENAPVKINGVYKVGDVTLKRGLIGTVTLFQWIKQVREGDQAARRSVTIQLLDEAHTGPVLTWKLTNARPIKYTGPTLNGKGGGDVAMEEIVLACERIDIE